jgi:hypothetical protein
MLASTIFCFNYYQDHYNNTIDRGRILSNNYILVLRTGIGQPVQINGGSDDPAFAFLGGEGGNYDFEVFNEVLPFYAARVDIINWYAFSTVGDADLVNQLAGTFNVNLWADIFIGRYLVDPWIAQSREHMRWWLKEAYDRGIAEAP